MAYGGSNDDVIDDVTWPWKVKVVSPNIFKARYFKNSWRERLGYNGTYRKWHAVSNGHVIDDSHMKPKGQSHDPVIFRCKYLENGLR